MMTKQLFIIGICILTLVSCNKESIEPKQEKKEDLLSISYQKFNFENLYDLVKNPISIDLLKRRLEAQKIEYKDLKGYEKDFYFIISDTTSVYKNYRIEVEAGEVLTSFDNPTSKDVKKDYVQNIIIYPLDENKKIITQEQTKEQYKGIFDLVKNSLEKINPDYKAIYRIVSLFGRGEREYEHFIEGLEYDDGIALWRKNFDVELTLENSSNQKNIPNIQMEYKPSPFGLTGPLPYDSKYSIQIRANLPKDINKILFK